MRKPTTLLQCTLLRDKINYHALQYTTGASKKVVTELDRKRFHRVVDQWEAELKARPSFELEIL